MTQPTTVVPGPKLPTIVGAGLTHAGIVRGGNEDSILTDPSGTLWAVADGMGGYGHGDLASDIVIEALATIPDGGNPAEALVSRLQVANAEIVERARRLGPMGSTAVALMIHGLTGHVAWAGDSRAYLLRRGSLRMLTSDHSVVQDMVDRGELSPQAAVGHPDAHVVTRAVGAGPELDVDLATVPLSPGDRLMLCSDGLSNCLDDGRIADRLSAAATAEEACRTLLSDALRAGAPDNVSVIVVLVGME